jgi:hypothetical protein
MEAASSIDFSAFCHCDVNAYATRSFLSISNRPLQLAVFELQPAKIPRENARPPCASKHLNKVRLTAALWLLVFVQEPKATMRV